MSITNRFTVTYKKNALSLAQMEIKRQTIHKPIFFKSEHIALFLLVMGVLVSSWIILIFCLTGVSEIEYPLMTYGLNMNIASYIYYKEFKYV